jgi:hypothetical protein
MHIIQARCLKEKNYWIVIVSLSVITLSVAAAAFALAGAVPAIRRLGVHGVEHHA